MPATTVDRQCGSSQQAVHFAAQGVIAGAYDVVIAAGVESMSRVPMFSSAQGKDIFGEGVRARYPQGLIAQGYAAELLASRWKLSREDLDAYAAESHRRAAAAAAAGFFDRDLVPVAGLERDETIRGGTTAEALAGLPSAFRDPAMEARYPEIEWRITSGSSSPLTDGASAVLIMSEERAESLGLLPRARFVSFSVIGDDPELMLTAPVPATRMALQRAGLALEDIDAYEVNEAFAPVPLVWAHELGAQPERLNPRGGAIALGHALGSTGTRLLCTLINHLEQTNGRFGLQTLCEAGGLANAMVIERL